jgi:hypothetical protein
MLPAEAEFNTPPPALSQRETLAKLYSSNKPRAKLMDMGMDQDQAEILLGFTPDGFLELGENTRGERYTYVSIYYVRGILTYAFNNLWHDQYKPWTVHGDEVIVSVTLTIFLPGNSIIGEIKHDATGSCNFKKDGNAPLGKHIAIAETNALKRAAAKIGIAWDVDCGLTIHPSLRKNCDGRYLDGPRLTTLRATLGKTITYLARDLNYPLEEFLHFLASARKKSHGQTYVPTNELLQPMVESMDEDDASELIQCLIIPDQEASVRAKFIQWLETNQRPDNSKLIQQLQKPCERKP